MSFWVLGAQSSAASGRFPVTYCPDPIPARVRWHYSPWSSDRTFLKVSNSIYHFSCQAKGCWHDNTLLRFKIKTRTRGWRNCQCQAGAASSCFMISQQSLCWGQVISAVQHRPEGQGISAAQPETVPTQVSCDKMLIKWLKWVLNFLYVHIHGVNLC